MNSKRTLILIVVLIVLLAVAVAYIGYGKFKELRQQEQTGVFQQGAQYGYEQLGAMMFQQAASCQSFPITFENQTINLVAIECLQQ
tara:strand:+ start:41 stop:298 length:258 start_codon:yes stop_codon:yes gene_type:complete